MQMGQVVIFKYPERDKIESPGYLTRRGVLTIGKSYVIQSITSDALVVKNDEGNQWYVSRECFVTLHQIKRNLPAWF